MTVAVRRKRDIVERWMEVTTFHGWSDMQATTHSGVKLLWFTVIIAAMAMLGWQLSMVYLSFMQGELQLPYSTPTGPYYMTSLYDTSPDDDSGKFKYPPVTICPFARLMSSRIDASGLPRSTLPLMYMAMDSEGLLVDMSAIVDPDLVEASKFEAWYNSSAEFKDKSLPHIVRAMSPDCGEITLKVMYRFITLLSSNFTSDDGCYIETNRTQLMNLVSPMNFTYIYTREFGMCTRYLFPDDLVVQAAGLAEAIHFVLGISKDDVDSTIQNNYMQDGYAIQIGEIIKEGKWVSVSPGLYTSIALTRSERNFTKSSMPLRQPECIMEEELADDLAWDDLEFGTTGYNDVACKRRCEQREQMVYCPCAIAVESNVHKTCLPHQYAACLQKMQSQMSSNRTAASEYKSRRKACFSACKPLCRAVSYDLRTTIAKWPTPNAAENLARNIDPSGSMSADYIKNAVVPVTIYFDTLEMKVVERYEKMKLEDIVGTVGGQMGVWAGASLLSVVQIVIHFATYCCTRNAKNKVSTVMVGKGQPVDMDY